ncbi:hypothetical protein Emed_006813 [Eimeria media]
MPRKEGLPSLWSCGHARRLLLLWWIAIFTALHLPRSSLSIRLWGTFGHRLSDGGPPAESRFVGAPPPPLADLRRPRFVSRLNDGQRRNARCYSALGFQTLDLIKIFGRLADASAGNSALISPFESPAAAAAEIIAAEKSSKTGAAGEKAWSVKPWLELHQPSLLLRRPAGTRQRKRAEQQLQPWEHLFVSEAIAEKNPQDACMQQWVGLAFEDFCRQIKKLKFAWPTTINSGQAPLSLRSVPECVFRSFLKGAGSGSSLLCREDVLRCIWSWAPADGTVDWEQFLFSLDEIPSDGLQDAVD